MWTDNTPNRSLGSPLRLPIKIIKVGELPKIIAGGVPVTPINWALEQRVKEKGASADSLDVYKRAVRLYVELCAHLGRSLTDISNADFNTFKAALTGTPFLNIRGESIRLVGKRERGKRTADLMLSLIYSIARDIEEAYSVSFDWLRYGAFSCATSKLLAQAGVRTPPVSSRAHRIKFIPRKVLAIPDDQFVLMIDAARELWGNKISDGDMAFSADPESQRGALFLRNAAILFLLRYAGCRRREPVFIEFGDVRRDEAKLYLVTKGHGGEAGERLPTLLFAFVDELIWRYVVKHRPAPNPFHEKAHERIFLSHSVRNYGQPITAQTVRKIVDALRERLDPPWDDRVTPHTLRHAYAYDLQKRGGPASLTANLRHKSLSSSQPYLAGVETFSEELLGYLEEDLRAVLTRTNLLDFLVDEYEK